MTQHNKELSIQITLGGFSFLLNTPTRQTRAEYTTYDLDSALAGNYSLDTIIEWSVPNVLIIPFELFDHGSIDSYLQSAALLDPKSERSMFAVKDEYVAVWAVDKELYDYIKLRMPSAEQTHSLLTMVATKPAPRNSVAIDLDSTSLLHLCVWSEFGLESAQCVQVGAAEDILFFIRRFSTFDTLMEYTLYLGGGIDSNAQRLLHQYYPRVTNINTHQ